MNICWYGPNLSSTGAFINADGVKMAGEIYPYFIYGKDDTDINAGYINTTDTGWIMHGSHQKRCNHAKYRGTCYQLADVNVVTRADMPDLPVWEVKFPNGYRKKCNYPFPMRTFLNEIISRDGYDRGTHFRKIIAVRNVCEPVQHPVHPDWTCYAIRCEPEIITEKPDENKRNSPNSGKTRWVTAYLYLFGDDVSSRSIIGRCYGYETLGANAGDLTFEIATDTIRWDSKPSPMPTTRNMAQVTVQLPMVDDRQNFNPWSAFGLTLDWNTAMAVGLNQVNFFDSNGTAFIRDVGSLPKTISEDVRRIRSLSKADPSGKIKVAAQVFLSAHYGYKLLAADGIELAEQLARYSRDHTLHIGQTVPATAKLTSVGEHSLLSCSGHLNVYYDPYAQITSELWAFAEAIDVVPDVSNIWDTIPFSFVVDWFSNIGELASGIDDYFTLTQQHKVLGSIRSRKVSYSYQPTGFYGQLQCSRYARDPSEGWFPVPEFSFQLKNPVTNLYHWLEGSALVVSRIM